MFRVLKVALLIAILSIIVYTGCSGNDGQVMYVWCDALSNYITAIGYEEETEQFKRYWPCDAHVIGKDILRFHLCLK